MIIDKKVSSIESSFQMDSMLFDEECRRRVEDVLAKNVSAQKMEDQENVLSDSEGT